MRTVWKFPLGPGYNEIWAPGDADLLTAEMQGGELYVWAAVNVGEPIAPFALYVEGTGHELPDVPLEYLSTVQMPGGLVWHVFRTPMGALDAAQE
jgi:hypothetical protein